MEDSRAYKCKFDILGGRCGEVDTTLEAEFELTDEELIQAIDALEEYDNRFNDDLPEAMYDAIWDVAWDQFLEDAKEEAGDEDIHEDELLDRDGVFESIFNITGPEVKE